MIESDMENMLVTILEMVENFFDVVLCDRKVEEIDKTMSTSNEFLYHVLHV